MEKTVYFLGSGFSKEAGGLVQNEIIKTILDEDFTRGNERLIKAKDNFIGFLKAVGGGPHDGNIFPADAFICHGRQCQPRAAAEAFRKAPYITI
mgnify:CR=1 FL=1